MIELFLTIGAIMLVTGVNIAVFMFIKFLIITIKESAGVDKVLQISALLCVVGLLMLIDGILLGVSLGGIPK